MELQTLMPSTSSWIQQAAAIPLRSGEICLVRSSSGKCWVVPKGCLEDGKSAEAIALQEAWEEAGLLGEVASGPVGTYFHDKYGGTCRVEVFLMHVTVVADDYPEAYLRKRRWVTPAQALRRVDNPGLRAVLRRVFAGEYASLQ